MNRQKFSSAVVANCPDCKHFTDECKYVVVEMINGKCKQFAMNLDRIYQ